MIYLLYHYKRDLNFYKSNNWDFLIENKDALHFQKGEYNEEKIGNKKRIFVAYPFTISVCITIITAFLFA